MSYESTASVFRYKNSCILNVEDMTTARSLVVISCKIDITVMCTSKGLPRSRSKICNSYFLLDPACRLEKFKKCEGANFLRNFEVLERERTKQRNKKREGNQSCSIYPEVLQSVCLADNRAVLCVQIKAVECCCENATGSGITNIMEKR